MMIAIYPTIIYFNECLSLQTYPNMGTKKDQNSNSGLFGLTRSLYVIILFVFVATTRSFLFTWYSDQFS